MNITINITPPSGFYKNSEKGTGSYSIIKKSKKSRFYKRPWFWVLLVFIVSIAVRALSKSEKKILTEILEEDLPPIADTQEKDIIEDEWDNEGGYFEEEQSSEVESEEAEKTEPKSKNIFRFILNTATKKYHTKECGAAIKLADEKRGEADIEADSLDEAKKIMENQGYTLCGLCDR